jgi:membrane fusion protein, copper/silver efflux system
MKPFLTTVALLVGVCVLLGLATGCSSAQAQTARFYCPMHPQIVTDRAGDCPICGMHLVPRTEAVQPAAEAAHSDPRMPAGMAPVEVDEGKRAELGLTFGTAEVRRISTPIPATARVVPDETRVLRVIARADGYVDSLQVDYAGRAVKKGDAMLSIYSPSIQASQQQFIGTTITEGRRYPNATAKPPASGTDGSDRDDRDDAFRERLKYWGFGEAQIERIQKTGKIENSLVVESPADGIATEKTAVLGQRVTPGDPLFVVTDLSRVWAEVDVPELDVPAVKPGLSLSLRMSALPGTTFPGKVKFYRPELDPATRTMKVYAEVPNPGLALKPGMLGSAVLASEPKDALCVPEEAVLNTGETTYVFVSSGKRLVPTSVVAGRAGGGYREILSGLTPGEQVVTSAAFLLDSESSLKAALASAAR